MSDVLGPWHPLSKEDQRRIGDMRGRFSDLDLVVRESVPDNLKREVALMLLQAALMFANAAISAASTPPPAEGNPTP